MAADDITTKHTKKVLSKLVDDVVANNTKWIADDKTIGIFYISTGSPVINIGRYYGDAGHDILSAESIKIPPKDIVKVRTGCKAKMPYGWYGRIESRSSMAANHGLVTVAGVIDSGYKGEIIVLLHNTSNIEQQVHANQFVAQVVFTPCIPISCGSTRGDKGFGSSSVRYDPYSCTEIDALKSTVHTYKS